MKKWKSVALWGLFLMGVCMFGLLSAIWPSVGNGPSDTDLEQYASSKNFDSIRGTFVNRRHDEYERMMNDFDFVKLIKEQTFGKEVRVPPKPFPTEQPNWDLWSQQEYAYVWLGHSTILFRVKGKNILFDPVFGSAAPVSFAVPRFQKAVVTVEELPSIDLVIVSHDHYDHLSYDAMLFFKDQPQTQFLVPLGVSSYLKGWGIDPDRISEMDWWDEAERDGIQFVCTPSQHFSGRTGPRGLRTLWASWVVKTTEFTLYFSGDSGYDTHFAEIGSKYGPFDIAFMETGQYNPIWPMSHMFPEESAQGGVDLKAKAIHPIHWGTFKLSTHSWDDPIKRIIAKAALLSIPVSIPLQGEVVTFPLESREREWFKEL
jgi:L-ascorbate metabolism protein UlaG (beta-lactamase superfamily)